MSAVAAAPIAIVSAMHEELAAVLDLLPDERKVVVAGREFWQGHLHGHEVVAVLARIGKVAAATTAAVLAERFKVDRVVFTGVAGGLGPGVQVGDVVVASAFLQHDMDASPIFPRHEVPLYSRSRFAADADLAATLCDAARSALPQARVHRGLVVSGDRFVSTTAEALAQSLVPGSDDPMRPPPTVWDNFDAAKEGIANRRDDQGRPCQSGQLNVDCERRPVGSAIPVQQTTCTA